MVGNADVAERVDPGFRIAKVQPTAWGGLAVGVGGGLLDLNHAVAAARGFAALVDQKDHGGAKGCAFFKQDRDRRLLLNCAQR